MKKIMLFALSALATQAAFADRAFYNKGLDCEVVGHNQGNIARVRLFNPLNTFDFTVMDLSFADGKYLIMKALRQGIPNRSNAAFSEVSVFEADVQGKRVLANVFSYAVKSVHDFENPRERGGYTGMRAKILTPFSTQETEVLCEPFGNSGN